MTSILSKLNKIFESRVRLGIMSILSVNEWADFSTMKSLMEVSDGNLATHLKALEKIGYIRSTKQFVDRKPNTRYEITPWGRQNFREHLNALEELVR